MALHLRPYRLDDEASARAAHELLAAEGFHFLLPATQDMAWGQFCADNLEHRHGRRLPAGYVPGIQLAAVVDGRLVGRASVRFSLNEWLGEYGGHIGYAVVPSERRRGYATAILTQALVLVRAEGVESVLVTCDDGNVGSARTIERCGGRFERMTESPEGERVRRYWFTED